MWAALGIGVLVGVAAQPFWPVPVALWVGLGCASLAFVLVSFASKRVGLARAGCVLLGFAYGAGVHAAMPVGPRLRGEVACSGVVVGSPVGRMVDVAVASCRSRTEGWRAPGAGRIRVRTPEDLRVSVGSPLVVQGNAVDPGQKTVLAGAPDPAAVMSAFGIRTLLLAREAAVVGPQTSPPKRELHGLLRALATGDRSGLTPAQNQVLRNTGTSHLIAISGTHVAAVASIVWLLVRCLRGLWALCAPEGLSSAWGWTLTLGLALVFVVQTGNAVSAQRAWLLACVLGLARVLGRPLGIWEGLGLAALGIVTLDPVAITTPGFQLSFGAVAGIASWASPLQRAFSWIPARVGFVRSALSTSLAATIGTLPAASWWFQTLSWTSPLANLFAVPLTSLVILPLALAAAWLPGIVGLWAASLGAMVCEALFAALSHLSYPPLHLATGPWGALALCGVFGLSRAPGAALALGLATLGLRVTPAHHAVWTWPDIGQGSAALLQDGEGGVVLVDTGRAGQGLGAWLLREGITRIDRLVLSHPDEDHMGAALEVLDTVRVGEVAWVGEGWEALAEEVRRRHVARVDVPERLHPKDPSAWSKDNDRSVVIDVCAQGWCARLPGDIEAPAEHALTPVISPVDLLVLAHHGSHSSSTYDWLLANAPRVALVQAGRSNPYGHPHADVLARLHALGIPVLRSDVLGSLRVELSEDAMVISARHAGSWGWERVKILSAWRGGPIAEGSPRPRPPRPPEKS